MGAESTGPGDKATGQAGVDSDSDAMAWVKLAGLSCLVLDTGGSIVEFSPAAAGVLGIQAARLRGRRLRWFVAPDDRIELDAFLIRVAGDDQAHTCELTLIDEGRPPRAVAFRARRGRDGCHLILSDASRSSQPDGVYREPEAAVPDITERRHEQQMMEELQKIARIGSWSLNFADRSLYWSRQTYLIHDLDPDGPKPTVEEAVHFYAPEARPVVAAAVEQAMSAGSEWDLELPLITATGRRIWVRAQGKVELEMGRPVRAFGAFQDITERREAAEKLRESEARYRVFVDHATDAMFLHDSEGRIMDVNRQACESLGYTREQLIGMTPFNIDPVITRQEVDAAHARLAAGELVSFESLHRRSDGSDFPVEVRIRQLPVDGAPHAVAFVRDISERHSVAAALAESERWFRTLAEYFPDPVFVLDPHDPQIPLRIIYVNPAIEKTHGYRPEELIGRSLTSTLNVPEAASKAPQRVKRILSGAVVEFETTHYHKEGGLILIEVRAGPIPWQGRTMVLSIDRDVTSQKRAEELSRRQQAELAHLARLNTMGHMATGLAHELNQPLAATMNYAGALRVMTQSGAASADQTIETLDEIIAQTRRAADVIRRIRSFVKRENPAPMPVDLSALIRESLKLLEFDLRQAGVQVTTALAPAPPAVYADAVQVQQVLVNLVRNACDAMTAPKASGKRLFIAATAHDEAVCIEVTDQGPGVTSEVLMQVFDPFFTTKPDGLGMGLAISRSIVEDAGGTLEAIINPNGGMTFRLRLPITETDPPVQRAPDGALLPPG